MVAEGTWVTPGKPEVDVDEDEEDESGDFIVLERGHHETAEVAEDSLLPANQTKSLTAVPMKLAQ